MEIRPINLQNGFGAARMQKCAAVAAWFLAISIMGAAPVFAVDNLIDHSGQVLTGPNLYITYWGIDWQNGFNDISTGLSSIKYQAYLEDFLNRVGGGNWIGTQLQYRNAGSSPGVVKGIWIDTTHPLPATPT
ncbi:MAG TPA: hypothetical protein VI382_09435, partial [Candidatus Manganitrophaceae bacterium]|nr:hypothetical protein [Candidatus Manganitrophaceae bacterium]